MDNMYVYQCEDSMESIFTAIYNVYEDHHSKEEVLLTLDDEPRLFATVIPVAPDEDKTRKVIHTLRQRFGEEDYEYLCLALASPDAEKAQVVYGTIAAGLSGQSGRGHLFDNLAREAVNRAFRLARGASRENGHLQGFIRFEELEQGGLYAPIEPKNNLLPFLMPHFSDRFPRENFILHDKRRNLFGIHASEADWYLLQGETLLEEELIPSAQEGKYQALFRHFCRSIAIEDRRNLKLQQGMLPLRFREYMTEF
jgi:probable DNA metabolism protein